MIHTILSDETDVSLTKQQAERLLRMEAIYECDECEGSPGEHVYHVSDPELESAFYAGTYPFEDL